MPEKTDAQPVWGYDSGSTAMSPMMSKNQDWVVWARGAAESLRTHGYFYDPDFSSDVENADAAMLAARSLGSLFIPAKTDSPQPMILTRPSIRAPKWRPFDRRESIGWHNDFSTRAGRPEVSLSWIRREDPSGPFAGAWRVASVGAILAKLRGSVDGRRLMNRLSKGTYPFGYMDAGSVRHFRIIRQEGMRFYGRALIEGARIVFDRVPSHTRETIALIEKAADSVGETLPASTGALLIVHNRLSLHDRIEQTVSEAGARRQAQLCFVKKLRQPLPQPCDSIFTGGARGETR